jgi:hypothetical protein
MTGRTIVVRLLTPAGKEPALHEFRNFGEDVFRWLRGNDAGEVDLTEVDASNGEFTIRRVKRSKSRTVMRWVSDEAERQHLPISLEERQLP